MRTLQRSMQQNSVTVANSLSILPLLLRIEFKPSVILFTVEKNRSLVSKTSPRKMIISLKNRVGRTCWGLWSFLFFWNSISWFQIQEISISFLRFLPFIQKNWMVILHLFFFHMNPNFLVFIIFIGSNISLSGKIMSWYNQRMRLRNHRNTWEH